MTSTARPSPTAALEALVLPKLDHVDLVTVRLPFVAPFGTSVHVWTEKEAMLMRLESGGVIAWSECVSDPDPFYAYETNTTARHIISDFLLPLVEPGITLGELKGAFRRVRGHGMAKATIENALLILIASQQGVAAPRAAGPAGEADHVRAEHRAPGDAGRPAEGRRTGGREALPPRQDEDQEGAGPRVGPRRARTASRTCRSWWTRTATTRSPTSITSGSSTSST